MSEALDIALVGKAPAYVPWVTNSWVRSSRPGYFPNADPRIHTTYEHALIERYWRDPVMAWVFAARPEDTNFCYGYLCGEHTDIGPVLHYLYVRRSMRDSRELRLGVAETLVRGFLSGLQLPVERITYTRESKAWKRKLYRDRRFRNLADEWFFNPYLAFDQFRPCA